MKLRKNRAALPSQRQKLIPNQRGYVLLEALFSLLILSIGLIVMSQLIQRTYKLVQHRQYYLDPAAALADSLLTDLEIQSATGKLEEEFSIEGSRGTFNYRLTGRGWPASDKLRQVSVTVYWIDRGRPGSFSLTTLLPESQEHVVPAKKEAGEKG